MAASNDNRAGDLAIEMTRSAHLGLVKGQRLFELLRELALLLPPAPAVGLLCR